MKKIVLCLIVLVSLVGVSGCKRYDVNEVLLNWDEISLTVKGNAVFVFNTDGCQYAYNYGRNEYRAMTDDASGYFVLRAHDRPTYVGQEFTASLTYAENGNVKSQAGQMFRVEKMDEQRGMVWLWCHSCSIGLVIRVF
jgi:hypothetical protein